MSIIIAFLTILTEPEVVKQEKRSIMHIMGKGRKEPIVPQRI